MFARGRPTLSPLKSSHSTASPQLGHTHVQMLLLIAAIPRQLRNCHSLSSSALQSQQEADVAPGRRLPNPPTSNTSTTQTDTQTYLSILPSQAALLP